MTREILFCVHEQCLFLTKACCLVWLPGTETPPGVPCPWHDITKSNDRHMHSHFHSIKRNKSKYILFHFTECDSCTTTLQSFHQPGKEYRDLIMSLFTIHTHSRNTLFFSFPSVSSTLILLINIAHLIKQELEQLLNQTAKEKYKSNPKAVCQGCLQLVSANRRLLLLILDKLEDALSLTSVMLECSSVEEIGLFVLLLLLSLCDGSWVMIL